MVKAPPEGWCFVGADVDSQELWIGSLLGDAQFGWSGSTALGWMNLQEVNRTAPICTPTASILGMTRDNAKIFNYGRIYGAGVKYMLNFLLKFNPNLSAAEACCTGFRALSRHKGRRIANRRDAFVSYAGERKVSCSIKWKPLHVLLSVNPCIISWNFRWIDLRTRRW